MIGVVEEVVQVEQRQIGVIPVTHAVILAGLTHVILEILAASGRLILAKCEQIHVMQEVELWIHEITCEVCWIRCAETLVCGIHVISEGWEI